jgi:NADPH-dependent 2,4-dienoyl-CoA reductase/sulfur reductase-like enzyme
VKKIVILGSGPAAVSAALAARSADASAEISLIGPETEEPYEKPPLSKNVLLGHKHPSDALIAGPMGLSEKKIDRIIGVCEVIDRHGKQIQLGGGRTMAYDALVIATGALCREIPNLPRGSRGVHYLRNAADAIALRNDLAKARNLVVIGGGLIGLEVASSCHALGLNVSVIEGEASLLQRSFPAAIGGRLLAEHQAQGVNIAFNSLVRDVQVDADTIRLTTTGGVVSADMVVVGIGVIPDVRLASECGLDIDNGIVVDEFCRTSDSSIFAAGDVTRAPSPRGPVRLESWNHALAQGKVAGENAVGGQVAYVPFPNYWSEQYDLYLQAVGWMTANARSVERQISPKKSIHFELVDEKVVFACGINANREISIARRLIERSIPVLESDLLDPGKPLENLLKPRS